MLSLAEALAALPDTADGIAARFAEQGYRGKVRWAGCCPVANYLTAAGFYEASVSPTRVHVWLDAADDGPGGDVETPEHVNQFVCRFDAGEWPELVFDDTADDADPTDKEPNP